MTGLEWLTEKVNEGHGAILIAQTDDGKIGVYRQCCTKSIGSGDTAEEALDDACAHAPIVQAHLPLAAPADSG